MKVPTWALTVGVIMILMGGCSTLSDYAQINTKENIRQQQEVIDELPDIMSLFRSKRWQSP